MDKKYLIKGLEFLIKGLKDKKLNDNSLNILKDMFEFLSTGCYFASVNNDLGIKNWKITLDGKEKNVKGMFVMSDDLKNGD